MLYTLNNLTTPDNNALLNLEIGKVLYSPHNTFQISATEQECIFVDNINTNKHKNISYDYIKQHLNTSNQKIDNLDSTLTRFMQRYAEFSRELIITVLPDYKEHLIWGRTSYRSAEISGRRTSKLQDDTKLHIDAFPSTPVHGKRILRVFCNINPYNKPRVWNLGEDFAQVLHYFNNDIPKYSVLMAKILYMMKLTKSVRSHYDHQQLALHNQMKLNNNYQLSAKKQQIDFAAQTLWIAFTDQVSHAALSGQFLLEQTFYLPINGMRQPEYSPLMQWDQL